MQLFYYLLRSKWSIEQIVQALIDFYKIDNATEKDLRIFRSYALGTVLANQQSNNTTLSQKIQKKLYKLEEKEVNTTQFLDGCKTPEKSQEKVKF